MHVAVDTWTASDKFRNSGICFYVVRLLQELRKLAAVETDLRVTMFAPERTGNAALEVEESQSLRHYRTPFLDYHWLWRAGGMLAAARAVKPDVLFIPTAQVLPLTKTPIVTTIHDLSTVLFPTHMDWHVAMSVRAGAWIAAKYSDKLITDSNWSKQDLVKTYNIPEEKVSVAYLGVDREYFNRSSVTLEMQMELRRRFNVDRPYIFHHGTIQPRKNLPSLIRAHRLLLDRHAELHVDLVLAGSNGWLYEETIEEAKRTDCARGRVILTGPLPATELAAMLKGAEMSVIPSYYEGFCLPMVEAMACGIPTIVSDTSCFREISSDVLQYFDPNSPEDIAYKIYQVLTDATERRRLSDDGYARSLRYSWRQCAIQTVNILADACGMSRVELATAWDSDLLNYESQISD